eukprot:403336536
MRIVAFTLISVYVLSTVSGKASWEKGGQDYEKLTAAQKETQLWEQITANQTPNNWFCNLQLIGLFTESMFITLKRVGDTFEDEFFGVRNKFIHTVGNTATVKWTPVTNSEGYTGIFNSGADHGIIRLSAAIQPDFSRKNANDAFGNFIPGFGLKLLRNGVPSGNLVAMFSVDGTQSWNFFKKEFSNHIPEPISTAQKILARKFATATPFIQYVGLSDIATYDQLGTKTTSPKFPFQLFFVPELRNNYPDDFIEGYQEQLEKIPANTLLYKVYALQNPNSPRVYIADLTITSVLSKSFFGDRYLFFKHQDMTQDLVLRSDLQTHVQIGSSKSRCPVSQIREVTSDLFSQAVDFVFKGQI